MSYCHLIYNWCMHSHVQRGNERNRTDYSYVPFVDTTYIPNIGYVSREERLDYLILHEANHYGTTVVMDKDNYRTHTSTLGPRNLGVPHEEYYKGKVDLDFIKVHPIYAF